MDLIVGALLEQPKLGAVFGPTLTCIFAHQFVKLRNSDRFWYENEIPPSSLDVKILKAIQDVSLAGLLCSSGLVNEIQPRSFYLQDKFLNAPVLCKNVAHLSFKEIQHTEKNQQLFKKETDKFTDNLKPIVSDKELDLVLKTATEKLMERKKKEYELWLISKCMITFLK